VSLCERRREGQVRAMVDAAPMDELTCGDPFEPACASTPVESSPGATAFYPFLLRDKGYFVVVATEQPPMVDNPVTLTSVTFGQSLRASIELALAAE